VAGPLVVLALGITVSGALDLSSHGVAIVGSVPSGLPSVGIANLDSQHISALIAGFGLGSEGPALRAESPANATASDLAELLGVTPEAVRQKGAAAPPRTGQINGATIYYRPDVEDATRPFGTLRFSSVRMQSVRGGVSSAEAVYFQASTSTYQLVAAYGLTLSRYVPGPSCTSYAIRVSA